MSSEEGPKLSFLTDSQLQSVIDQQKEAQMRKIKEACKQLQAKIKFENYKSDQQRQQRGGR